MLKKIVLTSVFILSICYSYAQTDSTQTKKINHYIGIQANPLFRQIINLNNNNSNAVINPYLLTYSFIFSKCGWGIQTGIGYNYSVTADKDAPANHQSKINDLFYRAGVGRKIVLSKKFEAEFSLDVAGDYRNDRTFSMSVTNFGSGSSDSVATTVTSNITSIGGGIRGGLNFYLSPKILLGTEANYYYLISPQKQNIFIKETITQPGFATNSTSTNENQSIDNSKFSLTLPAVLFLIVKF